MREVEHQEPWRVNSSIFRVETGSQITRAERNARKGPAQRFRTALTKSASTVMTLATSYPTYCGQSTVPSSAVSISWNLNKHRKQAL